MRMLESVNLYCSRLSFFCLVPFLIKHRLREGETLCICRFFPADNAPMTARRFLNLYQKLGDDDMFSSDLTDDDFKRLLGHMSHSPCLVLLSGSDECFKTGLDIPLLGQRMAGAAGPDARSVVIAGADHACKGHERELVEEVVRFLKGLCFDSQEHHHSGRQPHAHGS